MVGVSTTGVATNFLTLPIGNGVCQDPGLGTNGTQITNTVTGQTTLNSGSLLMSYSTSPATSGSGTQVNTAAIASELTAR